MLRAYKMDFNKKKCREELLNVDLTLFPKTELSLKFPTQKKIA